MSATEKIAQCKSCPWRVGVVPTRDIPRYDPRKHRRLRQSTIRSGIESMRGGRLMACHHSKPGDEYPCAGYLANQLGAGNNIGVRLAVAMGRLPAPIVDGEQHASFDDTLGEK